MPGRWIHSFDTIFSHSAQSVENGRIIEIHKVATSYTVSDTFDPHNDRMKDVSSSRNHLGFLVWKIVCVESWFTVRTANKVPHWDSIFG